MEEMEKTKGQLLEELSELRLRMQTLERSEDERRKMEAALRESERQFHQLMEASPVPMLISDKEQQTFFINQKFEELFGYPRQVTSSVEASWPLAPPVEAFKETIRNYLNDYLCKFADNPDGSEPMEISIACSDGSTRHIECRLASIGGRNIVVCNDLTEFKRTQEEMARTNEMLKIWICELELQNQRMNLMHQMGDALQACHNFEDSYAVIRQFGPLLFPKTSGALYERDESGCLLKPMATWGKHSKSDNALAAEMCRAFLDRQPFRNSPPCPDGSCQHLGSPGTDDFLCVPMMVAREPLGLLHLAFQENKEYEKGTQELALVVTEHLALSLANLRLKETLRTQAIKDPLTGLFNRRYMVESLEREFHRSSRKQRPVSIMMLDIDHFKRFNDNYGHDAGDALLKSLGTIIQNLVRKEDIACRFGGEEFIMILPDTTLGVAAQRAEYFRKELKCSSFKYQDKNIGTVTVSLGVAAYPDHGQGAEAVLRKADEALYQAKSKGRNRVEAAPLDAPSK